MENRRMVAVLTFLELPWGGTKISLSVALLFKFGFLLQYALHRHTFNNSTQHLIWCEYSLTDRVRLRDVEGIALRWFRYLNRLYLWRGCDCNSFFPLNTWGKHFFFSKFIQIFCRRNSVGYTDIRVASQWAVHVSAQAAFILWEHYRTTRICCLKGSLRGHSQ